MSHTEPASPVTVDETNLKWYQGSDRYASTVLMQSTLHAAPCCFILLIPV
jgi:hypothetical protein